ncbi:alpha-mannosidase [Paenibacillus sp. MMS20-IR301]|uniref:alpha-mannosidase n=1 Tax=Paenibacillus sp. MMS20-IR301 TaxID=2895946 RepID=UPI0028E9A79D|nr:alpha-mannosidase [Paenibacillus sp. MMS20-IR301]WNS46817.1 alpha-mannosidase [Paenibacillus sp. MMS20-IR301]
MERINRFIRELAQQQWLEYRAIEDWKVFSTEYRLPGDYAELQPYHGSEAFSLFPSVQGTTYFFRTRLDIPAGWTGADTGILFRSGGEGLLRVNGASRQGLDRNHTFAALDPEADSRVPELEIELYDPIPEPDDPLNKQAVIQPPVRSVTAALVRANLPVQSLMYTATVIRDSALLLPEQDFRRERILEALIRAMDAFVFMGPEAAMNGGSIAGIEQELASAVRSIGGNSEGFIHMIGQSHIDLAWLWPARETVRKTSRTFSTVNALMEQYPDYRYAQSQPQLFAYLKENDPELYGKVKERIREGRWELVGGMWVEPDLNIPSGESLMRQMLYGQGFYQEEFGLRSEIEWLPDTFGYCASLPQILKHGKIRYFMTTKLGWNDTNLFPYDLFRWVGIDGTALLSFMNHGVNENTLPKDVHDHWQSYREKAVHSEQMLLYGHGDGGGGVTREMLEYINRSELMVGQPSSGYSTAADFFAGIEQAKPQLPLWQGDLYLELHRGTYTTHARNKRNNRKAEILYREAELWQTLAGGRLQPEGREAVNQALHDGWKLLLFNQFHDIIPGSSIPEVYQTSEKEYKDVFSLGEQSLKTVTEAVVSGIHAEGEGRPYVVLNSLGWARDMVVELQVDNEAEDAALMVYDQNEGRLAAESVAAGEQSLLRVRVPEVPAFGYKTVWVRAEKQTAVEGGQRAASGSAPVFEDRWETDYYRLSFNERGEIISLYDKEARREIVKPGERANRLYFFHDRPVLWDAWDIDSRYEAQPAGDAVLLERRLLSSGPVCDVLFFRWSIGQSEIRQELILYHADRRIDFKTTADWHEAHKLLKVGFPVDVITSKATYEIPFGALERVTHRNTSWEQAQYEVCGHRFADVSEHDYGVSLLNDCKYGYDIQGSTIRLSLLRAPRWPDHSADQGTHEFTYSLYPHRGDWRTAHTLRKAAELNHPAYAVAAAIASSAGARAGTASAAGMLPAAGSFIPFDGKQVILDTVKPAEDGSGSILRLYESAGGRETVKLSWPQPYSRLYLSNALEEEEELLQAEDGVLTLEFRPFEIKTVKIIHD